MATPTQISGLRIRDGSIDQTKLAAEVRTMLAEIADKANTTDLIGGDNKLLASLLPDAVVGGMKYKGVWDAATNAPAIPAASTANQGFYYKVSVSGTTTIDGESDWSVGDWIVSNGTSWDKIDNSEKTEEALTTAYDKTVKNLLQSSNVQGAIDELAEKSQHREIRVEFSVHSGMLQNFVAGYVYQGITIAPGHYIYDIDTRQVYVVAASGAPVLATGSKKIEAGLNIVAVHHGVRGGVHLVFKTGAQSVAYWVASNSSEYSLWFENGAVAGSIADQVRILKDNAALAARFIRRAALTGTADGTNAVFTLVGQKLIADTDEVFVDGMLQEPGTEADYVLTVSGADTVVTFNAGAIPSAGSRVRISGVKA